MVHEMGMYVGRVPVHAPHIVSREVSLQSLVAGQISCREIDPPPPQ